MSNLENPKVSVIVLGHGSRAELSRCIKSLAETEYSNLELIIVDQSRDGGLTTGAGELPKYLQKLGNVLVVHTHKNMGVSFGRNLGAMLAEGDILCFIDSDTEVTSNWLAPIVELLKAREDVAICQSMILDSQDGSKPLIPQCFIDVYGGAHTLLSTRGLGGVSEAFYASGASLAVRREVFKRLGMFDPYFFYGYEEADLAFRAWLTGYSVVFVPSSRVRHPPKNVLRRPHYDRLYYLTRGRLALLIKNYGSASILRYFIPLVLFMTAVALHDLLRRRLQLAMARIKALVDTFMNLKYLFQQRSLVSKLRRVGDSDLVERGLIIKHNPYLNRLRHALSKYLGGLRGGHHIVHN